MDKRNNRRLARTIDVDKNNMKDYKEEALDWKDIKKIDKK